MTLDQMVQVVEEFPLSSSRAALAIRARIADAISSLSLITKIVSILLFRYASTGLQSSSCTDPQKSLNTLTCREALFWPILEESATQGFQV